MGKEYKSIINYADGILEFLSSKWSNWNEFKVELKRSQTYKGLVSSFTSSMTYVKRIRDEMVIAFDKTGVNTEASLTISISNKNGERNSFQQVGDNQTFSLDFAKAEIDETSISLNAEDSSFANKFWSRHKEKIDFITTTNLDGGVMSDYESDLDTITLHDRTIELFTKYIKTGDFFVTPFFANNSYQNLEFDKNTDPDSKETISFNTTSPNNFPFADSLFYLKAEKTKVLDLQFRVKGTISDNIGSRTYSLYIKHFDQYDNFKTEYILGSGDGSIQEDATIVYNDTIEVLPGESLGLYWDSDQILIIDGSFIAWDFYFNYDTVDTFQQTTAQCIKPLKAFRRLAEVMTGDPDAVYSEVFGLESEGYDTDGEWANLVTLNGKMIRNFPFGTVESINGDVTTTTYNVTFEELFKYYNSIFPLSLAIENTGVKQRIRIEKYADLYDNGIVINLGSTISELIRQVRTDSLFTTIIGGYKDQEYEEVSGLDSAHGEINFTSPLKVKDKKYDIKCKARTGGYDIEFARRKQFADNATVDTRYDKSNYLIDAYIFGDALIARKDELFANITGVFNPQNIYNARLLPSRNVRRHGGVIKESLNVNNDDFLIYTKGANNPNVSSQLFTEAEALVEKNNIPISELENPKVLSELLSFKTPLTLAQYNLINLNKNKLITFVDIGGKELSGYVDSLKYDEPLGEAEMVLIRSFAGGLIINDKTKIPITITVIDAERQGVTDVFHNVKCEIGKAFTEQTEVWMNLHNANGNGWDWNPLFIFEAGETVTTRSFLFQGCNPSTFTVTYTPHESVEAPEGYEFVNLPFEVIVSAF